MTPADYRAAEVVWTGNPLSAEGTRGVLGGAVAELLHIGKGAVTAFGATRWTRELRRSWWLYISDADDMRLDPRPVIALVLVDLMPEAAKREAEIVLRWAVAARAGNAADHELLAENARLRVALADAVRRPMGVVPASAEGLLTTADLDAAESRRIATARSST